METTPVKCKIYSPPFIIACLFLFENRPEK
jgi:hypothetical protein